jgi:hypothetical protein
MEKIEHWTRGGMKIIEERETHIKEDRNKDPAPTPPPTPVFSLFYYILLSLFYYYHATS